MQIMLSINIYEYKQHSIKLMTKSHMKITSGYKVWNFNSYSFYNIYYVNYKTNILKADPIN